MEINKDIELFDLAIYLREKNILIISDTHIGFEEALNKQGLLVPRFQFKDIIIRLEKIFNGINSKYKNDEFDNIIINGDIKHEFGRISETEWRHTLKLIDFLLKKTNEIILIKGNHDTILGPIAKKRKVKVVDEFVVDDILVLHGDKIPKNLSRRKQIKTIIIGHEHPAVSLEEMGRMEIYKCFLLGKFKNKDLIVQPSFNLVTEGTDILKQNLLSPFLKDIKDFRILVAGEEIYDFGKVKDLIKQ
ncbi:MAG: metallophosphoesterase [Candidatus Woesearchaeota archaeon]